MRLAALVTALVGAATAGVAGAVPGAVAVGHWAGAIRVTAAARPAERAAAVAAGGGGKAEAASSWDRAIEVPGLGTLNKGGNAWVNEVSCASAGNCAAGGYYADGHRDHQQGFAVVERNGIWGKATGVPGLGALNKGGFAGVSSVSCAAAGNCAAGGFYVDGHRHQQGFAVVERNGVWGKATEVPGLGALNKGGFADVSEVSCAAAGNCAAGGDYADGHDGHEQGFVVSERNGVWGKAIEVPGLGALNKGGDASIGTGSVSCASPGNCAAGGDYTDSDGNSAGFVVSERNGIWGKATGVPGLGALNKGDDSDDVNAVSCGAPGNCAAGGDYTDGALNLQGFVVSEKNGVWGKATEVPGLGALNKGGDAQVNPVSCASAGNCAAGGDYTDGALNLQGFVVSERNGVWGKATEAPGQVAPFSSVSCAAASNCAAGGFYFDGHHHEQGYVAVGRNGRWGKPIEVPGLGALNQGGFAAVDTVSCPPAGSCVAGGNYTDRHQRLQVFVVSQTR